MKTVISLGTLSYSPPRYSNLCVKQKIIWAGGITLFRALNPKNELLKG